MENGFGREALFDHLAATLLPHPETRHPRNNSCTGCGPYLAIFQPQFSSFADKLVNHHTLTDSSWSNQQNALRVFTNQVIRNFRRLPIHFVGRR